MSELLGLRDPELCSTSRLASPLELVSSTSISLSVDRFKVSCSTVWVLVLLGSVLLARLLGSSFGLVGSRSGICAAFVVCV